MEAHYYIHAPNSLNLNSLIFKFIDFQQLELKLVESLRLTCVPNSRTKATWLQYAELLE